MSQPTTPDDSGKLLAVVNAALIGVPGVYAVSQSLAVTAIAAVSAVALAEIFRRRCT